MHYRKTIAVLIIALALPAAADFRTVARAYEVQLSNFTAPTSTNGATTFRECDACELFTVRVNAVTDYRINDQSVTLPEFRKRMASIQNRAETYLVVIRHLESDTIEQILVDL